MSIAEHALFASHEDKENARENLIALQKQLKIDGEKRTALKWAGGLGALGLLAWWMFGKRGDGGGKDGGSGTPYDGTSGTLSGRLATGPTFVSSVDGKSQTIAQLIAAAKYNNLSVEITVPGDVLQGSVNQAHTLLERAGIKALWK